MEERLGNADDRWSPRSDLWRHLELGPKERGEVSLSAVLPLNPEDTTVSSSWLPLILGYVSRCISRRYSTDFHP